MEKSQVFESSNHAAASPSGAYIASLTRQNLYVQHASSLAPAFTFPLDPPVNTKPTTTVAQYIQWSSDSKWLLLYSTQDVLVFSIDDPEFRVKIANGSGSLGNILAVEILADQGREQVMTVWEFGRVSLWDLSTGRATELGDVKTGIKGTSWAIRRASTAPANRQPMVNVLLSRQHAQDVLVFYLPPKPTPFRTVTMPTVDAQSISWSSCGRWLSILDSSLSPQQLHVYSAEGFAYRTYPSKQEMISTDSESLATSSGNLGFKTLAWAIDELALVEAQTLTFLTTRTFSRVHTLHLSEIRTAQTTLDDAVVALQEVINAAGQRSHAALSGQSIPVPTARTSLDEPIYNSAGSHIVCRDDSDSTVAYILDAHRHRVHSILLQRSAIRKLSWHPSRPTLLLITSDDATVYLWNISFDSPPIILSHDIRAKNSSTITRVEAHWLNEPATFDTDPDSTKLGILLTSRRAGYQLLWPEGRPIDGASAGDRLALVSGNVALSRGRVSDETDPADVSHDSLYDILMGKTPLPELKVQRIEAEAAVENTVGLDDTFREKAAQKEKEAQDQAVAQEGNGLGGIDDDSEIF